MHDALEVICLPRPEGKHAWCMPPRPRGHFTTAFERRAAAMGVGRTTPLGPNGMSGSSLGVSGGDSQVSRVSTSSVICKFSSPLQYHTQRHQSLAELQQNRRERPWSSLPHSSMSCLVMYAMASAVGMVMPMVEVAEPSAMLTCNTAEPIFVQT